ncbi:MAG: peptidylprolyl isomerase [Clostridia bacterium]|nr:peptidylprolyl isomerase [Clostridia bacterium]
MKKTILTFLLTAMLAVPVIAQDTIVIADGKEVTLDNPIKIIDNISYIPLREISEKILNADIIWDSSNKSAILNNSSATVIIPIGSSSISVNNTQKITDAPAFIENGITYVPVRALSEGFNMTVGYENKTITISRSTLPQLSPLEKGETIAAMHTNYGDIKFRFFPEYAPKAVENFLTLAEEGYYNNITFHRVINNFMIQGGDPDASGAGGESIWGADFENEITPDLRHFRGALCMANRGIDPSNGSQFYIVQNKDTSDFTNSIKEFLYQTIEGTDITYSELYPDNVLKAYEELGGCPSLDFGYTVFGQVIEGMDIVDIIAAVETDSNSKPVKDVIITGIDIYKY